jgi:D-tyrosyl-tRNA(Tyr) deacylase
MRVVVQRVSEASVTVDDVVVGRIGRGLLALVGAARGDTLDTAAKLADKVVHLRVFADSAGKMNLSLLDVSGALLVVSQFTLLGDCRKGRRPSYGDAADGDEAAPLVEAVCARASELGIEVARGRFGAHMSVALVNDGPVTLLLDTAGVL